MDADISQVEDLLKDCLMVNTPDIKCLLSKVYSLWCSGRDIQKLFPLLVKLLASKAVLVKKIVGHIIQMYSNVSGDLALLVGNTLLRECSHPNASIRCASITALCSLPLLSQHHEPVLKAGLRDASAKVRRTSCMSCIRVHQWNQQTDLVNTLYECIKDPDSIVSCNSLLCLEEILKAEGGVVVNKRMAFYLLNRLSTYSMPQICYILEILRKYETSNEEEIPDILNALDAFVCYPNPAVMTEAVKTFRHFVGAKSSLQKDLSERVEIVLQNALKVSRPEMSSCLFRFITNLDFTNVLKKDVSLLSCFVREPLFLKKDKLRLIPEIVSEDNLEFIVEQVCFLYRSQTQVRKSSISCMVSIALKWRFSRVPCMKCLLMLGSSLPGYTLLALNQIGMSDAEAVIAELRRFLVAVNFSSLTPVPQMIWLCIVNSHVKALEKPYILEAALPGLQDYCEDVKCMFVDCASALFLVFPAEVQIQLARVFEVLLNDQNVSVKEHATRVYGLLKTNPKAVKLLMIV